MPSTNKAFFLSQDIQSFADLPPISAAQVDCLISHYQSKYQEEKGEGICLYKNGGTVVGKAILEKNKSMLRQAHAELRLKLQDEKKKYYHCMVKLGFFYDFEKKFSLHHIHIGREVYDLLLTFLETQSLSIPNEAAVLRSDLTDDDLESIHQFVNKNALVQRVLDELIQRYLQYCEKNLERELANCGLLYPEAWQEINYLQNRLTEHEALGYVYTGGHNQNTTHMEMLIITKNAVIKPISWYQMIPIATLNRSHAFDLSLGKNTRVCQVDLYSEVVLKTDEAIPCAQGDKTSCAVLGFKYLKELLKNNQEQLKEYSLQFPFYDEKEELTWFFYPSPQVLRYSQSGIFNHLIRCMLTDTTSCIAGTNSQDKRYEIASLKKLLTESLVIAEKKQNLFVLEYNTKLLTHLNAFRTKWLSAYKESMHSRQQFHTKGNNKYLMYSHQRMLHHCEPPTTTKKRKKDCKLGF